MKARSGCVRGAERAVEKTCTGPATRVRVRPHHSGAANRTVCGGDHAKKVATAAAAAAAATVLNRDFPRAIPRATRRRHAGARSGCTFCTRKIGGTLAPLRRIIAYFAHTASARARARIYIDRYVRTLRVHARDGHTCARTRHVARETFPNTQIWAYRVVAKCPSIERIDRVRSRSRRSAGTATITVTSARRRRGKGDRE